MYSVKSFSKSLQGSFQLPFSKSESNRALIICALCNYSFRIENLSDAEDTQLLKKLLASDDYELNSGAGGTTFRFLLSFLALQNHSKILSGNERLNQRPVKELAEALNSLGANISYLQNENFPPLKISKGDFGKVNHITINAGVSSQFISSLLLIAPKLSVNIQSENQNADDSLIIQLNGKIVSSSYIEMTLKMMNHFGVETEFVNNIIKVKNQKYKPTDIKITADWSAASYFYEAAVIADEAKIFLKGLQKNSIQGDEIICDLMIPFGIKTTFTSEGAWIEKVSAPRINSFEFDFINCPDLAQTLAFTCAAVGIEAWLTGLDSLPLKESNRIEALKNEIEKIGTKVETTENSLHIFKNENPIYQRKTFNTYDDHRMVMSLSPLTIRFGEIFLNDIKIVSKSFPNFWGQIKNLGITERST